jgi:integrase
MGKRRGSGEGSIYRRKDGRWAGAITLPGGGRKYVYGRTYQEARRKLEEARRLVAEGLPMGRERLNLRRYLLDWLGAVRPSLRPRTWQRYEECVRLHVLPALGDIPLVRLSPAHLQSLYAQKLQEGPSPASVRHVHAVLRRSLGQAEAWGLLPRNVARLVRPPRREGREMAILTQEEVLRLLEAAQGDRLAALYTLALATGMRQGELLALRWRDVDLERGVLQVRATLQRTREGFVFAEPKTARSRCQVTLAPGAVEALRRHRRAQLEERLRAGELWEDHDLVFCDELGRPLSGTAVTKRFRRLLERAGLPRVRFHDLRHTAASHLLARGVHPKVVADMLGHSTVTVTLDLYSHVAPSLHEAAAQALDELVRP